jgi:predicted RNA-binding protein with PIN domain
MPYLVDGHNLIPKLAGFSLSDLDDEQHLLAVLQVFCRVQRCSLEVYFDRASPGSRGQQRYGLVKAYFVHQSSTADQAILNRLRKLGKAAQNWTVVSSDRMVQTEARALKASVVSSEEFARLVQAAQRKEATRPGSIEPALSEDEVQEWLRLFEKKKK